MTIAGSFVVIASVIRLMMVHCANIWLMFEIGSKCGFTRFVDVIVFCYTCIENFGRGFCLGPELLSESDSLR